MCVRVCNYEILNRLQIKFERQKRVKRIREMETSLCKELGEKSQLSMKSSLPSEDALKCYLHRVEGLEQTLVCSHSGSRGA